MNRCTPGQSSPTTVFARWHATGFCRYGALGMAAALSLLCNPGLAQITSFSNASTAAAAQVNTPMQRSFPPKAKRANMTVVNAHEVTLNGHAVRLSPGSRIRSTSNALTVSGGLIGHSFVVNYTTDTLGQAHEIWILTAAEATERRAGSDSATTYPNTHGEQ